MISVGVPAFDRFYRHANSTNPRARLLGVAGTDVPVEDIDKLTLPYKVGTEKFLRHFVYSWPIFFSWVLMATPLWCPTMDMFCCIPICVPLG